MWVNLSLGAVINLDSQTHRVWGSAGNFETGDVNSYDITDSEPVSGEVFGRGPQGFLGTARSSSGNFEVSAFIIGDAGSAVAKAELTYLFSPITTNLSLIIDGFIGEWAFENQAKFTLKDVTADMILEDFVSPQTPIEGFAIDFQQDYLVDPMHQYQLYMFVLAQRGEGGDGSAGLTAMLVPEPMTILLVGFGAILTKKKMR